MSSNTSDIFKYHVINSGIVVDLKLLARITGTLQDIPIYDNPVDTEDAEVEYEILKVVNGVTTSIHKQKVSAKEGGGGGGEPEPEGYLKMWDSVLSWQQFEGKTFPKEKGAGENNVVYNSHAGSRSAIHGSVKDGILNMGWQRARFFFNFFEIRPLVNERFIFYATKTAGVENISQATGIHGMKPQLKRLFGKYGVSFHRKVAESKVEFHHEPKSTNGKEKSFDLPDELKPDKIYGYMVDVQTVRNEAKKALNAWIDYDNNGSWIQVVKNRLWTKEDWKVPRKHQGSMKFVDEKEVYAGVYLLPLYRNWIRCNPATGSGAQKANIGVLRVELGELPTLVI